TLIAGSTQTITWSTTNAFDNLLVSVQRSGRTVQSVDFVPMAAGRFDWTICPNIGDGADYGIQLATNTCGVGVSESDGVFTITGSSPPATATLTSPTGGEAFTAGGVATATWDATNAGGNVLGILSRGGRTLQFLGSAPTTDGRLDWGVCSMLEDAADYAIRLLGRDCDGGIDITSPPFAVTGSRPRPTFAIDAPQGGRRFRAGTSQTITWTAENPMGIVFATLERGGRRLYSVGSAPISAGRLDWDICPVIGDDPDYAILLSTVVCSSSVSVRSGTFEITGSGPPPSVVLTSPAGGETFTAGASHLITWDATNPLGDVFVIVSNSARSLFANIGSAPMADGQLVWDICPGLGDATDARITVLTSACGLQWEGEAFTITGSTAPPVVTPTSPLSGETFLAGTRQTITWTPSNSFGNVGAFLGRDGLPETPIGLAPMADGTIDWFIDPTLPSQSNYFIRLLPLDCSGVAVHSPFFSIEARRAGDVNGDRIVDLMDHRLLIDCLLGPDVIADEACRTADFNADARVDLHDVGTAHAGFVNP
ncbi:MAG: dockerin type I domain-containing protein, partial [Phycisphaerae bacterium]